MMAADLLDRMRRNPAADWTIADVEKVCRDHGPIKPVYIRKFVHYIEEHGGSR